MNCQNNELYSCMIFIFTYCILCCIDILFFSLDGEEIKLVRMRREEIINCICGHREEDGLMVQCELCLCWQHALCHGIQRERDVPDKYVCAICTNPQKPRQSRK